MNAEYWVPGNVTVQIRNGWKTLRDWRFQQYSRCIFSVLLRWANAIKVCANAIKMPDQHKYEKNGALLPTKCLEEVLKYSYNVSIFFKIIYVCGFFKLSVGVLQPCLTLKINKYK